MRPITASVIGALFLLTAPAVASAEVQLSILDGRVTLVATDATVRQILVEWARVGQTKIVNVERIPGGPLTLQLSGVPEPEALDLLLRSVTGYMAAKRPVAESNLSRYDRILVLPTAAVARVPVTAAAPPAFQPLPRQSVDQDDSDEGPSIPSPRGPVFPGVQVPGVFPSQVPQPGRNLPAPVEQPVFNPQFPNGTPQFPGANPQFPGGTPPFPGGEGPNGPPVAAPTPGPVGTPRPGMVMPVPVQPGPNGPNPQSGQNEN